MNKYFGVLALIVMIAALVALCNLSPVVAGDTAPTVTPPPNPPRVTAPPNPPTSTPIGWEPPEGYPAPATATPPSNPYPGPVYDPGVDFTYLPLVRSAR